MPPKKNTKNKIYQSFKKFLNVHEYAKDFYECEAVPIPEPLPGRDLLEPVAVLKEKPAVKWKDKDVLPIARLIAGRMSIDATGDNFNGANAFGSISDDFTNYILCHPKIRAMVDPVYVVIDLPSAGALVPPANIANYPPANSPHVPLALVNPSTYIYTFPGPGGGENAQHFIGWLQGANPGVLAYIFRTPVPVMQY